jgi:hypothetical protein
MFTCYPGQMAWEFLYSFGVDLPNKADNSLKKE